MSFFFPEVHPRCIVDSSQYNLAKLRAVKNKPSSFKIRVGKYFGWLLNDSTYKFGKTLIFFFFFVIVCSPTDTQDLSPVQPKFHLYSNNVSFDVLFIPIWWARHVINYCSTLTACNVFDIKFLVVHSFMNLDVLTAVLDVTRAEI